MVLTKRVVLQFFILILFTVNGLHSYPRHQPSLGILNELLGQDSNSPLIVVVDSNNQARTLNYERDLGQEQRKGRHVHNTGHQAAEFTEREYENALYELLRTSERMIEKQLARSSQRKESGKNGKNSKKPKSSKNSKNDKKNGNKKDSCENSKEKNKQEFLAEQCSKSENSCEFDNGTC